MSKQKSSKPLQDGHVVPSQGANSSALPVTTIDESSFATLRDRIHTKIHTSSKRLIKANSPQNLHHKSGGTPRGKKRNSNGAVVEPKERSTSGLKPQTVSKEQDSSDNLQKYVKELGGTDEDLALINGAASDSELEGEVSEPTTEVPKGNVIRSLEHGMHNILQEIALAKNSRQSEVNFPENNSGESDEEPASTLPIPESGMTGESIKKGSGGRSKLRFQPRADWYNISPPTFDLNDTPKHQISPQLVKSLHSYARKLLTTENEMYKSTQQSSSSQSFYNTVIASGTISDKISALTLAVQESPLHNIKALESLVGLASKHNRAQAIDALRALKDLFAQGSLLPADRKLCPFDAQPGLLTALKQVKTWREGDRLPKGLKEVDMICWAYESWLKEQYFHILEILERLCNDEIEFSKSRAISYISEMLKEKPEQESNLLRLLINKLGDPIKKIASQTSYLLMQLLVTHPAMKMVVISMIESDFIFRSGQSLHGRYYATVTINQTALSMQEENVAHKLLDIYFGLFSILLKSDADATSNPHVEQRSTTRGERQRRLKKAFDVPNQQSQELRDKLISAILTGINRAYPYGSEDQKTFDEHIETLFRVTHSANFNTSVQAMMLLQQLTATHRASANRFYRSLYESLLDPRLVTSSKQQLYLNLLHRSLKTDSHMKRLKAFVKRLLQILSLHDPAFICAVFFLLKDIEATFPSLKGLVDHVEEHDDEEEEHFHDADKDDQDQKAAITQGVVNPGRYDGHKRAPEFANADNTCAWELLPYLAHYHPSVSLSGDNYLHHHTLPGKPDLAVHTLIHFLDRFVYRNPKISSSNKMRGTSIMQPMAADDTRAVLISSGDRLMEPAVNTEEFKTKKDTDVAAEDVFFHRYFAALGKAAKAKKIRQTYNSDDDSIGDEGEDEVWKAMMDSAPNLEGPESEDEEELGMSDLDDEMIDDEEGAESPTMNGLDSDVDIEAGIFDDSDEGMSDAAASEREDEPDFVGISGDDEEGVKDESALTKSQERKRKRSLPTFASAADYAKLLDNDDDEDFA